MEPRIAPDARTIPSAPARARRRRMVGGDGIGPTPASDVRPLLAAPALGSPAKWDLSDFLGQHDKILEALSLFIALTVFAQEVRTAHIGYALSFLFLIATGIILVEFRDEFPPELQILSIEPRIRLLRTDPGCRLNWFSIVLDLSFLTLVAYSVWEFLYIWAGLALLWAVAFGALKVVAMIAVAWDAPARRRLSERTSQIKITTIITLLGAALWLVPRAYRAIRERGERLYAEGRSWWESTVANQEEYEQLLREVNRLWDWAVARIT